MGATLEIAPATSRDGAAVKKLLGRCGLPTADVDAHINEFVLARKNGTMVGVAGLERAGSYGLLRSVAVDPAERSRGIGAELCQRVLEAARQAGMPAVFLLTTEAAKYFERLRFSVVGRASVPPEIARTAEFTTYCPASAIVMRRAL